MNFSAAVVTTGVSGASQTVTVSNTGGAAVALTISVTGDFTINNQCPATLAAATSCQAQVIATPSAPGARSGLLSVTGGSGFAPAYVTLSATGSAILPANNGTLNLGQTLVGEPVVVYYKLQQALSPVTIASSNAAFGVALVEDNGGGHAMLPAYAFAQSVTGSCSNCYLGVQFLSQTAGAQMSTLTFSTVSGGKAYAVAVTASALPVTGLILTPVTQDFGPVTLNSASAAQTFTLTNLLAATATVAVTSVAVSGDFSVMTNASGGASCAGPLAPNASCYVQVVFAPTATSQRTGTLTIVTSAGTVTSALSGNGLEDLGYAFHPDEVDFRNAPGTASQQQTVMLSNTATTPLTVGAVTSNDASVTVTSNCGTLAAGAACTLTVTFMPGNAPVMTSLNVPLTRTVNGQTTTQQASVAVNGTFTAEDAGLEILPNIVNFGTTATGSLGGTRQFTLNNLTAHAANVTLSLPRQFPLATPGACATLAANSSCTFSVSFLPATGGEATGTVFAYATPTDGSAALQTLAYMLGYGAAGGTLGITGNIIPNSPLMFGVVASGQTAAQVLTLTNNGASVLDVRRITSEPPFNSTTTCDTALAANQTCTVTVTYAPSYQVASGTAASPRNDTGSLVIESDAQSSPDFVALSGNASAVTASSPSNAAVIATYQLSEAALTFANTAVGSSATQQTITLMNSGTTVLHVANVLAPVDFTAATICATLAPGASCTVTVGFVPTAAGASTTRSGTLEIQSDAAVALDFVTLLGTSSAAPLTLTPTALDFGTVNVGSSAMLTVNVMNTTQAPVVFNGVSATGDYTAGLGTCPATGNTLAAGASCNVVVTFTPGAGGTRMGTLSIATNATAVPLTVSLTGNATAAKLQITPGSLAFGNIAVGAPATLPLALLNTGTATVTSISAAIIGVNPTDFAVTTPCSTSSLAPNQGCTVIVTFTPGAAGARSATLIVASSDPASPATIPLTGTGAAAGSFTLTVNGGAAASVTVKSGSPASYALAVTPANGFTGDCCVDLRCGDGGAVCKLLSVAFDADIQLRCCADCNRYD